MPVGFTVVGPLVAATRLFMMVAVTFPFLAAAADLTLVSSLSNGDAASAGANGYSSLPIVTPDGRYVLFASTGNNLVLTNNLGPVPNNTPHLLNTYLRDRLTGATALVSVNPQGNGGNGDSFPAGISTNGQFALFESAAGDLVPDDTNNLYDVFVRDMVNNTTTLVSVRTNGSSGNNISRNSSITPDGRYVVFVSEATNLVAGDLNGIADVFVRDLQAGTTVLVSVGAQPTSSPTGVNASESPEITPDGRYVAFDSTATNLVPGVMSSGEVYVRDLISQTTTLVSSNTQSLFQSVYGNTNAVAGHQEISDDGQFITYEIGTTSLATFNGQGIVLRYNLWTGNTDLITTNANAPLPAPLETINNLDMTPDGRFVSYLANSTNGSGNTIVYLWDAQTGTNLLVSADTNGVPAIGYCDVPSVEPTGRYVVFLCNAPGLVTNLLNPTNVLGSPYHLYLYDSVAGTTQLIDVDTNGAGLKVDPQTVPVITDDGDLVVFDRIDNNFVNNDRTRGGDVFARHVPAGTNELVSVHHPALPSRAPNGFSVLFSTSVSTNGRYVAFASDADNLAPNDTNGFRDVFLRDTWAGTNALVSIGTNGFSGTNISSEPSISGDGRYVAFSSGGTRFAPAFYPSGGIRNIFVRDRQAGTTALITTNITFASIRGGDADSSAPVISDDGRYVLFRSKATTLAPGSFLGENLFVRDTQSATNYALTTSGCTNASMTPDAHYVAFVGNAGSGNNLYVWNSQTLQRVYTNTSSSLTNTAVSPDGHWVVFATVPSPFIALSAFDLVARTNATVFNNLPGAFPPRPGLRFSADGRFLVFSTSAAIAAGVDLNGVSDVYLHDFLAPTNLLISRNCFSNLAANGVSDSPTISPDGRFVAYRSLASNIVPGDTNGMGDLFLYDRTNNSTTLISINRPGSAAANHSSLMPVFSADSSQLVFESYASDLPAAGFNDSGAIFALSLSVPAIVDTDGDGMEDQWETNYFGTLARDGTGDFDGDGATDLFEFLTGTDPTDPNSKFCATISGTLTAGQNPTINWPLAPGKSYRVQYKDDLGDPTWHDLSGSITQVGSQGRVVDLTPATGQRWYRIRLN